MLGNVDPHDLNAVFGSYDKLCIVINLKDIKLTKVNAYKTHHPFVDRIVTSANSMWMHLWETTNLQEMQIARKLKPIREYNDKDIYDMNISKVGDLLLTLPGDTNLFIDRKKMTFS